MKKILIICNKYPLPEDTGTNIRTMNFVRFFQSYGVIDIAHRDSKSLTHENHPFRNIYKLDLKKQSRGITGIVLRLFSRSPKGIYEYSAASQKELDSLLAKEKYDYILVRYITTAITLLKLPREVKKKIILDVDDLPSDLYRISKQLMSRSLFSRIKWIVNSTFLKMFEKKCLSFGSVLFCSGEDMNKVTKGRHTRKTYVIPNILSNTAFEQYNFCSGYKYIKNLLFVGTLAYPPNIDGLNWFIQCIFPYLKRIYPDVKMDIIGRNPPQTFVDFIDKDPSINIFSNVAVLMEYYNNCGIVIVPILSGGGTRIKILEAGLASRPVMTTDLGAHGLDVTDGKDILIFSNGPDFVSNYEKLLDQSLYDSVAGNLKAIVKNKFSQSAFNKAMENVTHNLYK